MRNVVRPVIAVALSLAFLVAGCGQGPGRPSPVGPGPPPGPGGIQVVTTTTVFADIVRSVGGSRADVHPIIPPGVGPEDYEPKPDDARLLADAQLIVSNGVGLDDFLDRLLESGGGGKTPRLVPGGGTAPILVAGGPRP